MMFGTLTRIVSGGQTGADRGALNAARALSLPIGGWAPQGWRAEDGSIPLELRQYMRESVSPNYGLRTRLNVQDSDGTLILSFANTLTGGSKFTVDQVRAQRKPCKHLVLPRGSGVVPGEVTAALWDWIEENRIAVLNVAGPRESKERGIQAAVERVIRDLLEAKRRSMFVAAMAFGDANADAQTAAQKKLYPESMADTVRYTGLNILPFRPSIPCAKCGSPSVLPVGAGQCRACDPEAYEDSDVRNAEIEALDPAAAFHAVANAEMAAANEAMDRKEREVYGSGKYREAGDGETVIGLGPFLGLEIDIPPVHGVAQGDAELHAELCPARAQEIRCFIADCSSATTAEDFTRDRDGLIDRFYEMPGNGAGGSLHVVLDDGNHERSSVEFCRDYAIKDGDKAGEALARALLALPGDVYEQVLPPMEDPDEENGKWDYSDVEPKP